MDHCAMPNQNDNHNSSEHDNHDKHAGHNPAMFKQKFWLSLLFTVPTLVFSDTVAGWLNYQVPTFSGSQYISAIFGTIIFFYGGVVFLKSARAELANRAPAMMSLISLAITTAFIYSSLITFKIVTGKDFWWELASLVTIMLLGHWLEMASVQNAQGALRELAKLIPDTAELVKGNDITSVATSSLKKGDLVLVRPGTQVPADGIVVKGSSKVDESMISGESKPVEKQIKGSVIAGTINGQGSLTVKITGTGDETALAGIMRLVAEAQKSKSKTQILADRAAFYLTFIAIGSAFLAAGVWGFVGTVSIAFILERVVSVLIIACPHALGLAVPLVTSISTSQAASNGLLIRERSALENARKLDVILFDKTGTLTLGQQGVVDIIGEDTDSILQIAASIEHESEHPIAKSIVKYSQTKKSKLLPMSDFMAIPGHGAQAKINGQLTYIGGPALLQSLNLTPNSAIKKASLKANKNGQSVIYLTTSKEVFGALFIADVIRPESKQAIETLKANGKRVAMLSGDSKAVVTYVAEKLGIDEYFAQVLPENKAAVVKKLQADGSSVAMVGDGVNDAPALTQADVGIAIGAGTDVAIESAGIILVSNDPAGVNKVINLSIATYSKMRQNLIWATGYNALAIPLAAGVAWSFGFVMSPALGAILMSLSTVIVAINAQTLKKIKL